MEFNDVVISSRRKKGALVNPPRTIFQNISSWVFNKCVRFISRLNFYDTQCGAKLFKRKVITKVSEYNDIETGWSFDVDILNICSANEVALRASEHYLFNKSSDQVLNSKVFFVEEAN